MSRVVASYCSTSNRRAALRARPACDELAGLCSARSREDVGEAISIVLDFQVRGAVGSEVGALTDRAERPRGTNDRKPESGGSQRKAAVVVGLVCIGVVAAVVAMNSGVLSVHSEVSDPVTGSPAGVTAGPNRPPVILSVTPATDRIAPFDICEVVCEASDDDGDPLTYAWSVSQGDIYGEGATIEWGSPAEEGLYQLSVTVDDGRGGSAEFSASLRVKTNYAPQVSSLSASSDWIIPGASTYVACTAADADGDDIAYEWVTTGGETFGQGRSIVWVAPSEPGSYWITVFARDAYAGEARRGIPISVSQSEPPTISKFVVKGVDTDLVRQTDSGWKIFRGRSCSIECVVASGDGPFTFSWHADKGTLTPDGAITRWDAFDGRGEAAIVVDVTDIHGNVSSGIVSMAVETCTCSFK
jgi:hypothetical protein